MARLLIKVQQARVGGVKWLTTIQIIAFGPLAEELGWREHTFTSTPQPPLKAESPLTPAQVVEELDILSWAQHGLTYHINGKMVSPTTPLYDGDELALLPPVSGG